MQKLEPRILSLLPSLAVAALFATGGVTAQAASEPEKQAQEQQQEQQQSQNQDQSTGQTSGEERAAAPVRRAVPHVTGTVTRWTGNRIDLKTPEGKVQKVAVNQGTERLVEIEEGAEVTVEYRRKISGFVIAERVLGAEAGAAAGTGKTPARSVGTATGQVVSWNNAALLLRTEEGDVNFYLSPSTEYLVESLNPGLPVTVEYREGSDRAKMATRVLAVQPKSEKPAKSESGSE
jgi:hypothetical protein